MALGMGRVANHRQCSATRSNSRRTGVAAGRCADGRMHQPPKSISGDDRAADGHGPRIGRSIGSGAPTALRIVTGTRDRRADRPRRCQPRLRRRWSSAATSVFVDPPVLNLAQTDGGPAVASAIAPRPVPAARESPPTSRPRSAGARVEPRTTQRARRRRRRPTSAARRQRRRRSAGRAAGRSADRAGRRMPDRVCSSNRPPTASAGAPVTPKVGAGAGR